MWQVSSSQSQSHSIKDCEEYKTYERPHRGWQKLWSAGNQFVRAKCSRKMVKGLRIVLINLIFLFLLFRFFLCRRQAPPQYSDDLISAEVLKLPNISITSFQSPDPVKYRIPDIIDTFETYKYRNVCKVSSLDLHAPFRPLCSDRQELLKAMSSGGRIGFDAPYMPRGCDMRWFSTEEICRTLSRFEKVIFIGDSMMRHVAGSLSILTRENLGYGAVTDWNFSVAEKKECFCNRQFDAKSCSVQGIYKTADVIRHDPRSLACLDSIDVMAEVIVRYPIPDKEIQQLRDAIGNTRPTKPIAFIFGHGLWNDLDLQKTVQWTSTILSTIKNQLPYHDTPDVFFPKLFMTPNAAGKQKPDEWIVTQGNKALMIFEEAIAIKTMKLGIDHLGTWNMSIQSSKYDGVHLDMKGNLVKGMMVLNWLSMFFPEGKT